ncbi:hypothetical protein EQG49_02215 [Periweissella cryptocerci]|uniref:Uncharacterized protein n=1 Tax=Periweissella cryptocerci TaxID=2506420 RepID=A0A4P6YRX4_9LACO|nr:hypothetical protein [Periweissella cryptocerci]QBO35362.1 hypothetical protein EQG49_02215 [Periweissella cryptocerci]
MSQNQKAYIVAEGLVALTLTVLVITWFAVNQHQLHVQLSTQEARINKIRQQKERSDEEVADAIEEKASIHTD